MVDLGEDEDKFESFMAPITSKPLLCGFPLYNVMSALVGFNGRYQMARLLRYLQYP